MMHRILAGMWLVNVKRDCNHNRINAHKIDQPIHTRHIIFTPQHALNRIKGLAPQFRRSVRARPPVFAPKPELFGGYLAGNRRVAP